MRWPAATRCTTDRLDLEPVTIAHADEMASVLASPELYAFTGGEPPSAERLRTRYAAQARGESPDGSAGWLTWIVRDRGTGRAVGFAQATLTTVDEATVADLAWVVTPDAQGRGIASEAAAALVAWLRRRDVRAFVAWIHPDHAASAAVAARLGLAPTADVLDGEVRWTMQAASGEA